MPGIIFLLSLAFWLWLGLSAAFGSAPSPGATDPEVVRWITEDLVADDRSALTLDGQGVRFVGQEGRQSERQETPTPVPVPPALWLLAGAVGVLAMIGRNAK